MFITADTGDDKNTGELRQLESAEQEYIHTLCITYYPTLKKWTGTLGFYGEVVDDWLQETFLVAIQRIGTLRKCKNPGAYLTQILRNVIGHQLRNRTYAAQIAEKMQDTEISDQDEYMDEPDPEILYRGLVSDEELSLLIRFYLEGWSQKDLARDLGIDVEACKKRIQRAKAHLKAAMKRDGLL